MTHDKILFLDCDGVLNCNTDFTTPAIKHDPVHSKLQKGERWKIINAGMLGLLDDVITQTDAKIVLSTTWRTKCNAKKMTKIFQRYGDAWSHDKSVIVGSTPNYRRFSQSGQETRQREINEYLKEHDVKHYVILDDCKYLDDDTENWIKTDEYTGMTILHYYRLLNMLGRTDKYQKKFDRQE